MFIERGFVEQARFLVEGDEHGFETVRFYFFQKVMRDIGANLFDTFGHFDQHRHFCGGFGEGVAVEVGEFACEFFVGGVYGGFVDVEFDEARLEVQGQGGAVADGFFEAVAAHVAVFVFVGAEGVEGVAVAAVDGRARQPEEKSVGQGGAHFHAEVAFLRAVGFIHQHDDIFAFVQHAVGFAKFENGGDDDLARVLFEQGFEFGAGFGFDEVGDVGGVEGGADLRVEVEPVHHDDDGGVA